jgi:hypothetical protein
VIGSRLLHTPASSPHPEVGGEKYVRVISKIQIKPLEEALQRAKKCEKYYKASLDIE